MHVLFISFNICPWSKNDLTILQINLLISSAFVVKIAWIRSGAGAFSELICFTASALSATETSIASSSLSAYFVSLDNGIACAWLINMSSLNRFLHWLVIFLEILSWSSYQLPWSFLDSIRCSWLWPLFESTYYSYYLSWTIFVTLVGPSEFHV